VAGKNLGELSPNELANFRLRNLGFIFQTYNLIEVLTALENVEFPLLLQGVPAKERKKRAREALEAVGLGDLLNRRPTELSGGQQQRVAVARALVANPKLVLADEPTANLDSETGIQLIRLMRKLNEEKGVTFLFSTHDPKVIKAARRVLHLRDGKIVNETHGEGTV
jgi:putative ABC transport system ATP-binding protein